MSESAKHVEELTVMRFLDGELSQEREHATREHLIRCAHCRAAHEALKAETELLRAAVLEREEALPGHLRPRHADVSWVLVAMIAFGTLAVSTLWTRYVQPIIESMESIGLDGTSVATSVVIQGVLWEGWSDMLTGFVEGVALLLVAVAAGYVLHWGWRRFFSSAVTLSLLLVALSGVLAAPASVQAAIIKHDLNTYTLREGEVIDNDLIVVGKRVVIEGTVIGDLIVCARSVEVSGEVHGDVLGFAERIEINGRVGGNVRTCARTLVVDGEVGRNITAGGEVIRLRPGATLGGSFTAGSREVILDAPVARDLVLAAESSEIHARIGGSALVFGERLTVGPTGAIGGEAKFFGSQEPEVSADAELTSPFEFERIEDDDESLTSRVWALFGYWAAAFILGAAVMLVTPEATEGVVTRHVPDYGKSFLVGLIASVVLAAFTILASVTLVGLPLGLTTAFFLTVGLYFAQAYVGAYIGREILGTPTSAGQALGRVALGLLLIYVAKSIPVVGVVVTIIAALWGFGALSLYVMDRRKQTEKAVPAEA